MNGRRTYWHLGGADEAPSEYEITTSRLLYYVGRGFEASPPMSAWYAEYQLGSPLQCRDAEAFRDPRATTYASYTALQEAQEVHVDGLLASIEGTDYDRRLDPAWIATLARVLPPMRFPLHGLQMLACYVGQMAPGGRIVVACALEAGDEIRRIQRLSYRIRQLQELDGSFGADARALWQGAPEWQPLREVLERLLITYDWGEALVAFNVVLKPALDDLLMVRFGQRARSAGDELLEKLLMALASDCQWHRAWTEALMQTLNAQAPENSAVVTGWIEQWRPAVTAAVTALEPLMLGEGSQ